MQANIEQNSNGTISRNNFIKKIILVTQATAEIGTGFCIYERNNEKYCEYFYYKRNLDKKDSENNLNISAEEQQKNNVASASNSKTDQCLDLRRKILHAMLNFYQDILTSNSQTKIYIYTDLADYNFTNEINLFLEKIDKLHFLKNNQKSINNGNNNNNNCFFRQKKNFNQNGIFHLSTTEEDSNIKLKVKGDLTILILAAIQLQKFNIKGFKLILGDNKKYSQIVNPM